MTVLEKILYVIIILFCLHKLTMTHSCANNYNSELIHPSFFGYNI